MRSSTLGCKIGFVFEDVCAQPAEPQSDWCVWVSFPVLGAGVTLERHCRARGLVLDGLRPTGGGRSAGEHRAGCALSALGGERWPSAGSCTCLCSAAGGGREAAPCSSLLGEVSKKIPVSPALAVRLVNKSSCTAQALFKPLRLCCISDQQAVCCASL